MAYFEVQVWFMRASMAIRGVAGEAQDHQHCHRAFITQGNIECLFPSYLAVICGGVM